MFYVYSLTLPNFFIFNCSNADGAGNHDNNHSYGTQAVPEALGILEANDVPQLNLGPGLKETHSIAGLLNITICLH